MADMRGRWSWDVPGFEPPQPATTAAAAAPTAMPRAPPTAMVLRPSAGAPRAPPGDAVLVADRLEQLADSVQVRSSPASWVLIRWRRVLVACPGFARFVRGSRCELAS